MTQSHFPDHSSTDAQAASVVRFIEQMGLSAQNDGMPRIAGRMAGYFVIHGGPVSFADLAQALQVSRGSVSTNARLLAKLGFIERIAIPGDRQDYYQLAKAPFSKMIEGYLHRVREVEQIVEEAQAAIPANSPGTAERLNEMRWFYQEAVTNTENLLERLSRYKE